MFGFLRRRILKDHMKLVAQNYKALAYCQAFLSADEVNSIRQSISDVQGIWSPGERLQDEQVSLMLKVNMDLRRVYDATPARLAGMKKFDDEFTPLLGWDEYYAQYID